MNIVLIGPPGTGKGTMADLIEQEFGAKHISAGDLLREEVKKKTSLGKKAEPIMKAGKLVDDELVAQIVGKHVLKNQKQGFVLDGFPRTLKQAQILNKLFLKKKVKLDFVLLIETDQKEIVRRLSARRQCPKCNKIFGLNLRPKVDGKCDNDGSPLFLRDDDRPEVVKKRLEVYVQNAKELIEFYKKQGIVKKIDGNLEPKEVFLQIKQKIMGTKK